MFSTSDFLEIAMTGLPDNCPCEGQSDSKQRQKADRCPDHSHRATYDAHDPPVER
ncbi:hypothetical protein ACIQWY_06535 [Streptomyces albidoflavus]